MQQLSEKTALISGGGSWIGRAIAMVFAQAGADVIILGRREQPLQATAELINAKEQGSCAYHVCDIASSEQCEEIVAEIKKQHNTIDIVIHNAGVYPFQPFADVNPDEWNSVIAINLTGAYNLSHAVLPLLKNSAQGKMIFISSIGGTCVGLSNLASYCASKAGLNGLMRSLAMELAPHHICVNSILPGNIINTEVETIDPVVLTKMTEAIPLKRTGKPEEIASAALFLGSAGSNFITGQTFIIDGGESIATHNM